MGEWAALGEWLSSPPPLHEVDLGVMRECLVFVGRARASLTALEADLVGEIARREGDAAAEEILRRDQKRSRTAARKAVKVAAQLEWAPDVADKLASGAITPEAAGLILDAAAEAPVDHNVLLAAAEREADDLFRPTLKNTSTNAPANRNSNNGAPNSAAGAAPRSPNSPTACTTSSPASTRSPAPRCAPPWSPKPTNYSAKKTPTSAPPHRSGSPTRSNNSPATATPTVDLRAQS